MERRARTVPTVGRGEINIEGWWPDWSGQRAVIVASGPSAKNIDLSVAKGHARFIAVNESWKLAPWSDVLYGADGDWWRQKEGVPGFQGLKISQDRKLFETHPEIKRIDVEAASNELKFDEPGKIGAGGNSGFQALNLALQWKAWPIFLVGFDMHDENGSHWHGRHLKLRNPSPRVFKRWILALDKAAVALNQRRIKVYNTSANSRLAGFEKVNFEQAFAQPHGPESLSGDRPCAFQAAGI